MELSPFQLLFVTGILPTVLQSAPRHYRLVEKAYNWTDAQAFCRQNFADLATAENLTDLTTLLTIALNQNAAYRAWVGLYNDVNSWRWSLNDSALGNIQQWDSKEPNNEKGREHCVKMDEKGLWYDADCTQKNPFVCYNAKVDKFIYISDPKSVWTDAQAYCRQYHTDLASSRDGNENTALKNAIPSGSAWIGLYRDTWKWSDNTTVSTILWLPNQPDNSGGQANCAFVQGALLSDDSCSVLRPFVCNIYPAQRKVVRVEVRSSQDVNDPAVKAAILEKMKQKLQEQGLSDTATLKWREQPNGKVFYKKQNADNMENTTRESCQL